MIATLNLNGDYLSDALAAQVGGIGMNDMGIGSQPALKIQDDICTGIEQPAKYLSNARL